jgi:hypothetical protein
MEVVYLRPAEIKVRPNRRAIDPAVVKELAKSIKVFGLGQPITVRQDEDGGYTLVAGKHRLHACSNLGVKVRAVIMKGTDDDCRMWEIAENLHRAELSVLERSEQVTEWAELAAKKQAARLADKPVQGEQELKSAVSGQVAQKPPGRPEGGVSAAARELGIERTEVRRAAKIAAIAPEAKVAAAAAGLGDNQSALIRIAAEPVEAQVAAVAEVVAARAKPTNTVKQSMQEAEAEAEEPAVACAQPVVTVVVPVDLVEQALALFDQMTGEQRDRFRAPIEKRLADRAEARLWEQAEKLKPTTTTPPESHGGKPPYGWRKEDDGLVRDEGEQLRIGYAIAADAEGKALRPIAALLSCRGRTISHEGVAQVLKREALAKAAE